MAFPLDAQDVHDAYYADICPRCGTKKHKYTSLCVTCFDKMPVALQVKLTGPLNIRYLNAMNQACNPKLAQLYDR